MGIAEFYGKLFGLTGKNYLIKPTAKLQYHTSPSLYHYCSLDVLQKIISTGTLRFTDVRFLNDTTEYMHTIQIYQSVLKEVESQLDSVFYKIISDEILISNLANFQQDYEVVDSYHVGFGTSWPSHDHQKCRVYTCSFSIKGDLLPLWTYYGTSSFGCNLKFSSEELIYDYVGFGKYQEKVVYHDEDKKEIIKNVIFDVYHLWQDNKECNTVTIQWVIQSIVNKIRVFFKNSAFSCEEEFRIALLVPEALFDTPSKNIMVQTGLHTEVQCEKGFFTKGTVIVPYIDLPFEKENFSSVILGPYAKNQSTQQSVKEFLSSYNFQNVGINVSAIPLLNYNK